MWQSNIKKLHLMLFRSIRCDRKMYYRTGTQILLALFLLFVVSPAVSSAVRNHASVSTCRGSEFTCLDGTCIRAGAVCDTYWDCPDGSDEASCYSSTNSNLTEATVSHERYRRQSPCGLHQWRCADGACIAVDEKCDGKMDCPDRSDEAHALCGNIKPTVSGKCVLPPYPEHGTYVAINASYAIPGQSFEFAQLNITCEQGYGVVGDVVPYCRDGTWLKPIQKCVPFCRLDRDVSVHYYCQIPDSEGYRLCNQSEPSGTVIKPECNAPVYGSTDLLLSMTCRSDGKWNRIIKCKPECGRVTPYTEGLIWGGTEAVRGELPWQVAIYEKTTQKMNNYTQICGGSLVSNRIVISAAHCFGDNALGENEKPPASNYAVATNKLFSEWDHKGDKDAQKSELKSVELSPYYQGIRTNFQHDIAVLILETPFVYYINVRPVCLDFKNDFNKRQLQVGNFGKVAGWGLTGENGPYSPVLKVVDLPFVSIQECIRITPQTFTEIITGDKICAGYNNGTAVVCKGDSGGGLSFPETENGTTRYYLRGIVSTAPKVSQACNVFAVTTFTEVYQHKDFINQFMSTKCTLPPYPEHGVYEVVGDPTAKPGDDAEKVYLNVSCNHGHSVIGNNVAQCALGVWSTTMPECVPVCYLQEHPSVTYSCNRPGAEGFGPCGESEPRGTSVKPECGPGYYSPTDMPRMRCVGGTWDYVAQCTPECGRLSANATTLPWYVHINEILIKYSVKKQRRCGGTIISPNIVITAAHCFWIAVRNKLKPSGEYEVTKNYLDAISDEDKFPVKHVKVTDRYQGVNTNYQDDIALVILSRAFTYSMKLHPVCLDFDYGSKKKQLQEGTLGTVAVFTGYRSEVTTEQSALELESMPYIPVLKCLEIAGSFSFGELITDRICAGRKKGTLICRGNGGTGLAFPGEQGGVVRYYLRGIVSIGSRIFQNCPPTEGNGGTGLAFPGEQGGVVRYYLRGIVSIGSRIFQNCPPTEFVFLTDIFSHKDFIIEQLATSLPPRVMGWQETGDALMSN